MRGSLYWDVQMHSIERQDTSIPTPHESPVARDEDTCGVFISVIQIGYGQNGTDYIND